ncbi:MAG: CYTH domain-containing protein [Gammaproteobacteria bacterium]|nr:CYTH domain-containing protein [Gammaproteobacteria bacterium]
MAIEIERKFLVSGDEWRTSASGDHYRQGYLSTAHGRTVRVRVIADVGYLTVKGETVGAARPEYEYVIPVEDAHAMLDKLCLRPLIEKTRYSIEYQGLVWEIDEFEGENAGLVVAEVELESEDQSITLPGWIGAEVTDDSRYYNANLVANPYPKWSS